MSSQLHRYSINLSQQVSDCSLSRDCRPVDICFQGRISIPVRQKERSVWASVLYRTSWSCLSPGFWAFTLTYERKQDFSSSPASDILQLPSMLTKKLKTDLKDFFAHTSRMVISFSFSFPALFLTCVFLVSTHTTLSFTSDLRTHKHTSFIYLHGIAVLKTPNTESRLTLGCPGQPVSYPGRGRVGAPGRAAPQQAASPTWGSPTPAQRALSFHAAQGSPCLLGNPAPRRPAPHPPPPPCFVSRPPPAWLSDRYLKKE